MRAELRDASTRRRLLLNARLARQAGAEFLGTGLLLTAVIGSGIAAQRLSPGDLGLQLFENVIAIVLTLAALIVVFQHVSGAHFNPLITLADRVLHRELGLVTIVVYLVAQIAGAIGGTVLANAMFGVPTAFSGDERVNPGTLIGEVVAAAGLVLIVFALVRTGRSALAAPVVAAWIAGACWFTSSASFANPAVTIGRMFSDTFAGIAPASALPYIGSQIVGAAIGVGLVVLLFPDRHGQDGKAAR